MKARVGIVGAMVVDRFLRVPRLPQKGETVLCRPDGAAGAVFAGGKGLNQAVAAAAAGAEARLMGSCGQDENGHLMLRLLREKGVDCSSIHVSKQRTSGAAFVLVDDDGANAITVDLQTNLEVDGNFVRKQKDFFSRNMDVLLLQGEVPSCANSAASTIASENGCIVLINPAPAVPFLSDQAVIANADLLIPNKIEAAQIDSRSAAIESDSDSSETLAEKLAMSFPELQGVIVTNGAHGGAFCARNKAGLLLHAWSARRPSVIVNETGAGDAFCGAFASALGRSLLSLGEAVSVKERRERKKEFFLCENFTRWLVDAVEWGAVAGSLCVERDGAADAVPSFQMLEEAINLYRGSKTSEL